ncbi:MAG: DUF4384 domain-containing protein [Syntrophales bacterium]|nr:DUF4384 domain-containing protein [Syntrophales bacterium]
MKTSRLERLLIMAAFLMLSAFAASALYAGQSTITVADGSSCMGDDKSIKQTEGDALINAKRKATEFASTYLKSETRVKDLQVEKDLASAYANANIRIIEEIEKGWYTDPSLGKCYKVKIKAEVIPDDKAMAKLAKGGEVMDDPSAPLNVQAWTDKKAYKQAERIKVYIKGNKPFYARVLYKDVKGNLLQILPNPYRKDNYFNGGMVYEIPSGNDSFNLDVEPPFGDENIIVYSSSSPLGDIGLQNSGAVYQVKTKGKDVGIKTRGIKILEKGEGAGVAASEFFESSVTVRTGK